MLKIAILGASKPHFPLVKKAKDMGLEVHCFALGSDYYCAEYADFFYEISITDKEQILKKCIEIGINGIVSNAIDIAVPTMAYVSSHMSLIGNTEDVAYIVRNKYKMRNAVSLSNCCLQPRYNLYNLDELDFKSLNCDVGIKFPIIVKPIDSSCSNGVSKVHNIEELHNAIDRAKKASKENCILVEEFIDGDEISVEAISYEGKHYVLAITDKETTGAPYFVEISHHQPSKYSKIKNKIENIVVSILDSIGIKYGASHTELKITEDGSIYLIETASRGGGDCISYDLVQLSTGYDYVKAMISVSLGDFNPPVTDEFENNYSGIFFLCKETEYLYDFIQKKEDKDWLVRCEINSTNFDKVLKSQDRSGFFIYKSKNKINLNRYEKK